MTTTLIVLAHPEQRSFNGAWAEATRAACVAEHDTVLTSSICQMGFDAVEAPRHYTAPISPFDPLKAQEAAAEQGRMPADVQGEIDKLRRADRIVFHFPIWWFAPPASLKGWCDRVLAHGATHDVAHRFDSGRFRGRSVLFCMTTGSRETESGPDGKEGDVRLLLWPLAYTLRYLGFTVLQPEVVHGVHGYHEGDRRGTLEARLAAVLDAQRDLIAGWHRRAELAFNADTDFDAEGRLRPEAPSVTPFIRHVR